jgi:uncharacterized protein YneR
MNRSGATMSWDYFSALLAKEQPEIKYAENIEKLSTLFKYIEDNDLWRH